MAYAATIDRQPAHTCAVPALAQHQPGTLWQCDSCHQTWGVFAGRNLDQVREYRHWLGTTPDGDKIGNWFNGDTIYPPIHERAWVD